MSSIRLGLIGCGGMARTHSSRFGRLSSRLRLVAAADVDESKVAAVAEGLPDVKVATDYRYILNDVDAVLLSLPHHLHHPVTLECLAAGKHVLVEKPMANSERECLEMIEAAEKADRVLMVAYCMRYHPLAVGMKRLLEERAYGDVFQVSLWTEQHTQYPPDHWASKAETLGGGQLFSHGCHYIDLLLWYLGNPVNGCHLGTNYGTPWMEREGTSNVVIEFESGALGYHFGTWGAKGTRLGYSFHAHCTEGMIEVAFGDKKLIAHTEAGEEVLLELAVSGKHTENEMSHFLDCIETGNTPLTNGRDSLASLRVIWRLYEAEEKGGIADLNGLGLSDISRIL